MYTSTALKKMLKPPFYFKKIDGITTDLDLGEHCFISSTGLVAIDNFIEQALTEKYNRDFAKSKRWILDDDERLLECPYCGIEYHFDELPEGEWETYAHCPHCGRRVSQPKKGRRVW